MPADREPRPTSGILLCADDYALTNGISRSIIELAEADRLSATSAMTTSPHWPSHATWVARVRNHIAVGVHLNLTLGRPLGPMPILAPEGRLPSIGDITAMAIRGGLDRPEVRTEIGAEIERQLIAFEAEIGLPPDHVDGHQHVHALPVVRDCLLMILLRRYRDKPVRPLIRDPADTFARIFARRRAVPKAMALAWLSRGFAAAMRGDGFPVNEGFSGMTGFAPGQTAGDFEAAVTRPGPRHMVMCHPGYVDDELGRLAPGTDRRRAEHDALMDARFPAVIWQPDRSAAGFAIDWSTAWTGTSPIGESA
jgi:predicted glycoside hydrolase/deacetylase ChbG (UPF0249 family)